MQERKGAGRIHEVEVLAWLVHIAPWSRDDWGLASPVVGGKHLECLDTADERGGAQRLGDQMEADTVPTISYHVQGGDA
jgi:hypothetical protein